jgi:hypothetical protein
LTSKDKNGVDQIASALRRAAYLIDMLGQFGTGRCLRLRHLSIAEDRADDIVKIVRYSARQLADRLHATCSLQAYAKLGPFTLEELTLESVDNRIAGKPDYRKWENHPPSWSEGIETQDAAHLARSNERHERPATDAGRRERIPDLARRQRANIRHSNNVRPGSAEPRC